MAECKIVNVDIDESGFLPKLARFQNGELQSNSENKLKCSSFLNPKTKKTVTAVSTDRLTYVGEEDDNELFYTILTIRNKKTNKIRLVPVNTVSLNVYMPQVNSVLDGTINSNKVTMRDLNKQFGSKKSIRKTEQYEKMKMNVSAVEEELVNTVADIEIKISDLVTPTAKDAEKFYRPPINHDASTVDQVYDLHSIISDPDLKLLKSLAKEVVNGEKIDKSRFTPFTVYCLKKLKKSSNPNLKSYQIILYIDGVIKFFGKSMQQFRVKTFQLPPFPNEIAAKIREEFTVVTDNRRNRPASMRDKALCHILVLALIALNYQLDLIHLVESMATGLNKLHEVSRMLGAYTDRTTNSIVLKLPLAPEPVRGKRKKN